METSTRGHRSETLFSGTDGEDFERSGQLTDNVILRTSGRLCASFDALANRSYQVLNPHRTAEGVHRQFVQSIGTREIPAL